MLSLELSLADHLLTMPLDFADADDQRADHTRWSNNGIGSSARSRSWPVRLCFLAQTHTHLSWQTVTRHFRQHQKGEETSTNSVASIYAWTRGLAFRGKLDGNDALVTFAKQLEQACVDAIDKEGVMTKDLALAIHGKQMKREHYVTTTDFLDHIRESLKKRLSAKGLSAGKL